MRRLPALLACLALLLGVLLLPGHLTSHIALNPDFTHFESAHVHPLVLMPGGSKLLAVNTSDNRLSVFTFVGGLPSRSVDIPVGLEPVSVAALNDSTVWVVNQLSDNVSVVDLKTSHVRATLPVGDEPADVVFAGTPLRAYVSVAQEDVVKVYDPVSLALTNTIAIPGRAPRALATNSGRTTVYVAVLNGGNRTSVLSFGEAFDSLPSPNPPMSITLPPAPHVALIVQQQGNDWRDESGKLWNSKIKYTALDTDLAEISTASNSVTRVLGELGSSVLGLAVNPLTDAVAATSLDARNLTRFENNLRGHTVDTRVAYVAPAGAAVVANLNPHINYSVTPGPASEADSAIGTPSGVTWSADGARAYVTSLASNRLGVLAGGPTPVVLARVPVVAGPTGVAVDAVRGRIYVLGRNRAQLQTLAASSLTSLAITTLGFDPTPNEIVNGRRFFYGGFTSGHGDQSCASCHLFGDLDQLAWDLGNPQGAHLPPPPGFIGLEGFHPMKGPMMTQSLRGVPNTGRLHWRADRTNLAAFNVAFVDLMGRAAPLPDSQMTAFSDFVNNLVYPPNPHQFIDRSFADAPSGQPSAQRGRQSYFFAALDGGQPCNVCHAATNFAPGTNGAIFPDDVLLEDQDMKVPQLRNLYTKSGFNDAPGAQNKRGFGFTHDGAFDDLVDFLRLPVFTFPGGDPQRRDVEAFLMAFDTGMAPAVGVQVTFRGPNNLDPVAIARLDTLRRVSDDSLHVDLIAKGRVAGAPRGWLYLGGDQWMPDVTGQAQIGSAALRALGGTGSEVTITAVPRGSGTRMGIDRDRDGFLDGDERLAHSDPANPTSIPGSVSVPRGDRGFALHSIGPNPFRAATEIRFSLGRASRVECGVFDLFGRRVATLASGETLEAGARLLQWSGRDTDGRPVASGVYYVKLVTDGGHWTRPLVKLR
ncbi:MAG: hypothetical protein HOP12_14930 [Candidatus Eisenbacteria bacterium]|uniref:Cytochrome c domain-containing protein n=1 Tax=Eiseniibacteriota bacterium TaxID=2212470 RepID=A0A849SR38_UNCEI|nr:hypothetical protein [Candidatus Eisenbacteria bacterium]